MGIPTQVFVMYITKLLTLHFDLSVSKSCYVSQFFNLLDHISFFLVTDFVISQVILSQDKHLLH